MPPALIAAGVSAAGGIGSAVLGSNAANSAAKAQAQASAQQLAFQQGVYNQAQTNLNPYAQQGQGANSALSGLLGIGGNPAIDQQAFQNYLNSTNYQFTKNQGEQGIQYANAHAFSSGATAKALDAYNTGLAGNAITGYENMLQGQAGLGVQAASALNGVGVGIGQLNANSTNANAAAQGNAATLNANAWNGALQNIGKIASQNSSQIGNAFSGLFGGSNNGATYDNFDYAATGG